jgi:hypothetical protein
MMNPGHTEQLEQKALRLPVYLQEQWSGRTDSQLQMNWLSFRNNRLKKFKTLGELPIILEEFMEEYTQL